MGANDGNEAAYPGLRRRERIRAKGMSDRQSAIFFFDYYVLVPNTLFDTS